MEWVRVEVIGNGDGNGIINVIGNGNGNGNDKGFNEVEDGSTRSNLERVRVEIIGILGQNLQLANVPTFQDLVRRYVDM